MCGAQVWPVIRVMWGPGHHQTPAWNVGHGVRGNPGCDSEKFVGSRPDNTMYCRTRDHPSLLTSESHTPLWLYTMWCVKSKMVLVILMQQTQIPKWVSDWSQLNLMKWMILVYNNVFCDSLRSKERSQWAFRGTKPLAAPEHWLWPLCPGVKSFSLILINICRPGISGSLENICLLWPTQTHSSFELQKKFRTLLVFVVW